MSSIETSEGSLGMKYCTDSTKRAEQTNVEFIQRIGAACTAATSAVAVMKELRPTMYMRYTRPHGAILAPAVVIGRLQLADCSGCSH